MPPNIFYEISIHSSLLQRRDHVFFPKFVWMIRLDIFWSWGHPLSWERWPKRFIFVISIGETQEPIASNLYIEPPKKLDLPIFGWKICNFYILYVYKYLKRYKYISYLRATAHAADPQEKRQQIWAAKRERELMRTEISCGLKGEKLASFWFWVWIFFWQTWTIDPKVWEIFS